MAGSRRSRQQQQHQSHGYQHRRSDSSTWSHIGGSNKSINSEERTKADLDFITVLQETSPNDITKQILLLFAGLIISIILAVIIGIAAGMTISIHYFENSNPVAAHGKMNPRDSYFLYSGLSAYQKVTTLDPDIASHNILHKDNTDGNLDLGKVITTSASGQLNVLMVVQEETPLHKDRRNHSDYATRNHTSSSHMDYTEESSIPMTMEQAELLRPGYSEWKSSQPKIEIRKPTVLPTLCKDQMTYGFRDWNTLKAAIQEANSISAERFMKWNEYFATHPTFTAFEDDSLYYEQDIIFQLCPGAILRTRKGPITINAENIILECPTQNCVIDVGGTHFAFGANARHVLIRGIIFKRATSSSVTFYHDGAQVSFEDCTWISNSALNNKLGSVADVNSTSIINFYRCEIGLGKYSIFGGSSSSTLSTTSSLSIRI